MLSFLVKLCRVFDSETRQADLWLPPVHLRCSETADLHARVAGPRARAGRTQAGFQGAGSASSLTTEASRSSPLAAPLHPSSVESPGCVDSVSLRSPLPLAKAPCLVPGHPQHAHNQGTQWAVWRPHKEAGGGPEGHPGFAPLRPKPPAVPGTSSVVSECLLN